jgi:hypothetical protein
MLAGKSQQAISNTVNATAKYCSDTLHTFVALRLTFEKINVNFI